MASLPPATDQIKSIKERELMKQNSVRAPLQGTRKPRVLHILAELRPSGAEVMLQLAAPFWFSASGTQAILATGSCEGPYASRLRAVGFSVHHKTFAKKLSFFLAVFKLIRRGNYDVVHIHNEQANVFYGIAARLAGIKNIIYTIHNVYAFTGRVRFERIVMRRVLWLLRAIPVAPGASVAENEANRFFNRAVLVSNWCDTREFRPPSPEERKAAREKYGISDNRTVVVTLGNCNEFKNHSLLLQALKLLLQRRGGWLYLHAGADEKYPGEQETAQRLGIADSCRFLGPVDDPRSVLWAADIFAMPSLREGFSIAALEAVACGLPLVFSDAPGLRDLKNLIPNGFWAPLDPEAFAKAVEAAGSQDWSGSGNVSAAQRLFSPETGAKAYMDLYRGMRRPS